MAKYAEKACADCGLILPIPELFRWSERIQSGQSETPYEQKRNGVVDYKTRRTTYYRNRELYICGKCRRTRIINAILASAITGVIVVGFLFVYFYDKGDSAIEASNKSSIVDDREIISPELQTPPEHSRDETEISHAEENSPNSAQDSSSIFDISNEGNSIADISPIDRAIEAATKLALDSGSSEKWKADGKKGFIVVSEEQIYADKVCRNVVFTTIDGREQKSAPAKIWCKPVDGEEWQVD